MRDKSLRIGLAQIPVVRGDVERNLLDHIEITTFAAKHHVDVILFPELSLTGYELELLEELALSSDDSLFTTLKNCAIENRVIIIAGVPLKNRSGKPYIGSVIAFPDGSIEFYKKQYLHTGEEKFCESGDKNYTFEVKGSKIALAICADFTNPRHSNDAKNSSVDYYLVSALISPNGYPHDSSVLRDIAVEHQFPVLLANHNVPTGGWESAGKSSAWDEQGNQVVSAERNENGLVIVKASESGLTGYLQELDTHTDPE